MDERERYQAARKRVKQIKEFYTHLAVYVVVIGGLALFDLLDGGLEWVWWPALGWGIGLAIHAFTVYGEHGMFGDQWEERKIRELLGEKPKRGARLRYDDVPEDETPLEMFEEDEPPMRRSR